MRYADRSVVNVVPLSVSFVHDVSTFPGRTFSSSDGAGVTGTKHNVKHWSTRSGGEDPKRMEFGGKR